MSTTCIGKQLMEKAEEIEREDKVVWFLEYGSFKVISYDN